MRRVFDAQQNKFDRPLAVLRAELVGRLTDNRERAGQQQQQQQQQHRRHVLENSLNLRLYLY